ncbi:MAG: hypothetical protein H6Q18_846 [Bacteroidetes bacterium]|nr:hypothetical protein [Bacteroidota bacterium]
MVLIKIVNILLAVKASIHNQLYLTQAKKFYVCKQFFNRLDVTDITGKFAVNDSTR